VGPAGAPGQGGDVIEGRAHDARLAPQVDADVVDEGPGGRGRGEQVLLGDGDGGEDEVDAPREGVLHVAVAGVLGAGAQRGDGLARQGRHVLDLDVDVDAVGLPRGREVREGRVEERHHLAPLRGADQARGHEPAQDAGEGGRVEPLGRPARRGEGRRGGV
jgi:hypothetical protein